MKAAVHVDQLFFAAPGGIGTYIRNLVPALARQDPSLQLTLFHSRFASHEVPERWMRDHWVEELPASIRSLYPRWDTIGRPPLPATLQALDLVHATNPAAIPPATGGQRLVVTVHDLAFEHYPELFPRPWRALYRLGLRAAFKRADAILCPRATPPRTCCRGRRWTHASSTSCRSRRRCPRPTWMSARCSRA